MQCDRRTRFFSLVAFSVSTLVTISYYLLGDHSGFRSRTANNVVGGPSLTFVADEKSAKYEAQPVIHGDVSLENLSIDHRHSTRWHYLEITKASSDVLQASQAPSPHNTDTSSIHSDLVRCSRVMGISETRLRERTSALLRVEQNARHFLDAVRLVVPDYPQVPGRMNPCFYSNVTIGSNLYRILLTYFRPEFSKGLTRLKRMYSKYHLLKMAAQRKSLMCLPYFYIAGFPKCATTSLHRAIQNHPQIAAPMNKEPHWWTRVDNLSTVNSSMHDYAMFYVWTYLMFFKEACRKIEAAADGNIVTYDGSQSLLWDSNFFQDGQDYCAMPIVMSRVQPKAKFIVVMRNPTARLFSHYVWSFKFHHGEVNNWPDKVKSNISNSFHSEVVSVVSKFNECLKHSSLFECTNGFRFNASDKRALANQFRYKFLVGLYYVHIKKWLQFFPRDQFLFLRMEDMVADFASTMAQTLDFLRLDRTAGEKMDNWLTKANPRVSQVASVEMLTETKTLLDDVYGVYNKLLADLLADERYLWSDV